MAGRDTGMVIETHPGLTLKDELEARGLSANQLALAIRVPSGRITDIINGKRSITVDTAARLGRYFGNGARFWLAGQTAYDLYVYERDNGPRVDAEVQQGEAA
jgi:antitoxin HigA-1